MPLVDSIDYYDAAINRVQKSANSLVGTEREVAQEQLKRLQIQKALANGDYTGGLNLQASSLKELKDLWADANTTANEYLATLLKFNDLGESEGLKRQQEQLIDYGVVLGSLTTDIATSIGEAIGDEDITADFKTMILEPLASALTQLGSLLIAYGFASEAFKKAWGNPYTAIAAGAALIAVGSAISAAVGNVQSVSDGSTSSVDTFTGGYSSGTSDDVWTSTTRSMEVSGEFRLDGNDLVASITKTNNYNGR